MSLRLLLNNNYVNLTGVPEVRRRQRVSYKDRVKVHALRHEAGLTTAQITAKINMPESTIKDILRGPTTPTKPAKYAPRVVTSPARNRLISFVESSALARRMTYGQLKHHLGLDWSDSTVKTTLYKEGYKRFKARPQPFLNQKTKDLRLQWGLDHEAWSEHNWNSVIPTDEAAMHNGGCNTLWVTRKPGEASLPDCQRAKFAKMQYTMVYGGISRWSKSKLIFWNKKRYGNITAQGFIDHIMPVSLAIVVLSSATVLITIGTGSLLQRNPRQALRRLRQRPRSNRRRFQHSGSTG